MTDKRKEFKITHIGSSMLLIIFLIICLLMFAALSLSVARSSALQSEKYAARQTAYYHASNASQEILAALARDGVSETILTSLGQVTITTKAATNEHLLVAWQIPYSDTQALAVTVEVKDPVDFDAYTITQWQTISITDWTGTQTIPLMTGE